MSEETEQGEPYVRASSNVSPERIAELRARRAGSCELSAFIVSTFTLFCGKCGQEDVRTASSAYDAAGWFYLAGWRVMNEQPLCASCMMNQPAPNSTD